MVALSLVTTQRAAPIGVSATRATSSILHVCTRNEPKNKDHHKPSKIQVKKKQGQVKKGTKNEIKPHNTKKQPQLLLQIE